MQVLHVTVSVNTTKGSSILSPQPAPGSDLPPIALTLWDPQGASCPILRAEAEGGRTQGWGLKPAGRGPQPTSHLPRPQLCWPRLE